MDSHKTHKAFVQIANAVRATMSAVVCLVYVRLPLATYVKDILSQSTKTNSNGVIEFVS